MGEMGQMRRGDYVQGQYLGMSTVFSLELAIGRPQLAQKGRCAPLSLPAEPSRVKAANGPSSAANSPEVSRPLDLNEA